MSRRPALDPDAREKQLVNAAVDLAEKQLIAGTASPSVIVHFLKLGTANTELERERLKVSNDLDRAKISAIESTERIEKLYTEAMSAFGRYTGG
jgi:hypothetical protein